MSLSKKIKFEFKDLGGFEHILIELDKVDTTVTMEGGIVIDLSGLPVYEAGYENDPDHIIGVLGEDAKIILSQNGAEGVGSGDLAPLIDAIQQAVDNSQAQVDDIKDQLTTQVNDMIDEINRQLEGLGVRSPIGSVISSMKSVRKFPASSATSTALLTSTTRLQERSTRFLKIPTAISVLWHSMLMQTVLTTFQPRLLLLQCSTQRAATQSISSAHLTMQNHRSFLQEVCCNHRRLRQQG